MFGLGVPKAPRLITTLDQVEPLFRNAGYVIDKMPDTTMNGSPMRRFGARDATNNYTIAADATHLTFLAPYRLSGRFNYDSMQEWNANYQFASYTYSPEGDVGVLKHHMLFGSGLTEESLTQFVRLWCDLTAEFRRFVRLTPPRTA